MFVDQLPARQGSHTPKINLTQVIVARRCSPNLAKYNTSLTDGGQDSQVTTGHNEFDIIL